MFIKIGSGPKTLKNDPIGLMSECHRRIEYFLYLLITIKRQAQGQNLTNEQADAIRRAIAYFDESGPKHTADEEDSLFPLLHEHAANEPLTSEVLKILESEHEDVETDHSELKAILLT